VCIIQFLCLIVYFFCRLKINHDDSHEFILEFGTVANNVNDVCAIVIACVGRKEGKKEGQRVLGTGAKSGAVDSCMGPARAEVRRCVQIATIPSKRVIYTLNIHEVPHIQ
jgi:hypothetical protein